MVRLLADLLQHFLQVMKLLLPVKCKLRKERTAIRSIGEIH